MIRLSTLGWVGLAGVTCAALFDISYDVRRLDRELNRLNTGIVAEQDNIRVLRAEWWYLNQTPRLETLARNLTDLTPQRPDQIIADVSTLPVRLDMPSGRVMVAVDGIQGLAAVALPPRRPGDTVLASAASGEAPAARPPAAAQPAPERPPPSTEAAPRPAPEGQAETAVAAAPAQTPPPAAQPAARPTAEPPARSTEVAAAAPVLPPPTRLTPALTDAYTATVPAGADPIGALINTTGAAQEVQLGPMTGGLPR